jgi:UDP-N-acetylglucosamine 2-epimerase (hydrolysing)|tara:strand:- start:357 stop:1481 length:1125 start_codon:yes stop_codon:yes gene_type:complete
MKKILFVTGTRADYGKMKSLIKITQKSKLFKSYVFVTGMHLLKKYGSTYIEIKKDKIKNLNFFKNKKNSSIMSLNLAENISGFHKVRRKIKPDLIVVHGDRIEPMACALDGVLNNTPVAHIEGGEVSGTIDELIRHSISKICQYHFVTNNTAKQRLIQMGEKKDRIFVIGSPDVDMLLSKNLPTIQDVKMKYDIYYQNYSIAILHSVTTDLKNLKINSKIFFNSLKKSKKNYVLIYPNNDIGSDIIMKEINNLKKNKNFKILPSMKFEYFLTLLKNSNFIIGNSSSGIVEAPYYGTRTINVGNRQLNRFNYKSITNEKFNQKKLLLNINLKNKRFKPIKHFGKGNSNKSFYKAISKIGFWVTGVQKYFSEIKKV